MKISTLLKVFSPANFVLLLFGCIVLGVTIKKGDIFSLLFKQAHDFDYVLENGLKEGDHIEGDIYYNLGPFASQSTYTQYETYRTGSKTSGYYYVIPAGESGFAAVYVRKDDKNTMDKMAEETYEYLNSGADVQTVLHFNGVAVKMEKNLRGLESAFKSQLKEWGYTDTEMETMLASTGGEYLVLEGPADVTTVYVMGGIGLLMVALAIFLFLRRYKKERAWEKEQEAGEVQL